MGRTGAGKTTLLNKICGTEYNAGAGKSSVTRNLFLNKNYVGRFSFELIDTPGTKGSEEPLKHAHLLKEALTYAKLNTIFIVLKYENRFDALFNNFLDERNTITKFDKKIVLIITHADVSNNLAKDFSDICETFGDICQNILFYSNKFDSDHMADLMFACMSQMSIEKLTITEEEFFLKFDISSIPLKRQILEGYMKHGEDIKKLDKELKDLSKDCITFTDKYERDEFLQALIIEYKNQMDTCIDEFVESFSQLMIELEYYCLHIKLQKKIVQMCEDFKEAIIPYMSYSPSDPIDPRNLYKKCPYCQLVWVKVVGCDNVTCGDSVNLPDISQKPFRKFLFKKKNGKFSYIRTLMEQILAATKSLIPNSNAKLGCGKKFNWQSEAIRLIDEEIFELFTVKTIDEAKELIKNQKFNDLKNAYISTFDTRFYSE